MAWTEFLAPGVSAAPSPLETARFGVSVARVSIGEGGTREALLEALAARDEDVLIVRYPSARLEVPAWLLAARRPVLPAGSLTYWGKPVAAATSTRLPAGVVRAAELDPAEVVDAVRGVVRASFAGYGNHYSVNPFFDPAAALAGYEEWALSALERADHEALVLAVDGAPVGVATLELSTDADHAEILLAGLVPAAQGKGLYPPLLEACEIAAARAGVTSLVISTQVHNVRPQRVWARTGMRPFGAVETVHLLQRSEA